MIVQRNKDDRKWRENNNKFTKSLRFCWMIQGQNKHVSLWNRINLSSWHFKLLHLMRWEWTRRFDTTGKSITWFGIWIYIPCLNCKFFFTFSQFLFSLSVNFSITRNTKQRVTKSRTFPRPEKVHEIRFMR